MKFCKGDILHIYNQGNNKQRIFFQEKNYYYFRKKMQLRLSPIVDFLAYCLMPNHFHFLVQLKEEACLPSKAVKPRKQILLEEDDFQQQLSHQISILLRSYTRAINIQEERSGSLFRKRTKFENGYSNILKTEKNGVLFNYNQDYTKICFDYIHNNPTKAGLVFKNEDWKFSSFKCYIGNEKESLCNKRLALELGLI